MEPLDQILKFIESGEPAGNFSSPPQKYKNTRGFDLFGYPPDQLSKAALYYYYLQKNHAYPEANEVLNHLKLSLTIEEYALSFKQALFRDIHGVPFLQGKTDLRDIVLTLYSKFINQPAPEIKELLDHRLDIYTEKWYAVVPNEDEVTPEQLGRFYNSLPFPVGCFFNQCYENNLVIAYSYLPILLIKANGLKRVFDFGGNSGLITSALANSVEIERCALIEENEGLMEFARWRDEQFQIRNVEYQKESDVHKEMHKYAGSFDFGICTEVLEHLYDVEETVRLIAKLLRSGGILYQTTSFGLYPEVSHLKKNMIYAGHEDELMAKHGFDKVEINFPIPLLTSVKVYRKR